MPHFSAGIRGPDPAAVAILIAFAPFQGAQRPDPDPCTVGAAPDISVAAERGLDCRALPTALQRTITRLRLSAELRKANIIGASP